MPVRTVLRLGHPTLRKPTRALASIEAQGFVATVLQHELDHLDGVLFVDRIETRPGATPLAFTQEFEEFEMIGSNAPADSMD